MPDSTAPPRRMPVRVAHLTFDDVFDGDYAGWWADLQVNVPVAVTNDFGSRDWQLRKKALSTLVVTWNFVDATGEPIDPAEPSIWDTTIPLDLLAAMSDKFNTRFQEMTDLPKASPPPSDATS